MDIKIPILALGNSYWAKGNPFLLNFLIGVAKRKVIMITMQAVVTRGKSSGGC
jgi:hypothetical protein